MFDIKNIFKNRTRQCVGIPNECIHVVLEIEVMAWLHDAQPILSIQHHQAAMRKSPFCTLNSLAPGKFEWDFTHVIFKQILVIDG